MGTPSPDLAMTLSSINGQLPQLEQLRRRLVPLLAQLPLPHSKVIVAAHKDVDRAIRSLSSVSETSETWAHLLESNRASRP